ncbi:MAG: FG-GAP-like repeat-containing protein [Rudaea sp.]
MSVFTLFLAMALSAPIAAFANAQLTGFGVSTSGGTLPGTVKPQSVAPILAATPARDTVSDAVGATLAKFRVDESGNSTYSIPIQIPPGTAGLAPKLALTYNSRLSNGVMGPGWTIEGLSQISRCRQSRENGDFMSGTTPIDGDPPPVNFTSTDRFCLDGVRLLLLSGTYGVSGSTYSPETDPTTLVSLNGFFTVKRKDGTSSTYGDTTTSANSAPSASIGFSSFTVSWNISRMKDSVGNYIDYLYNSRPAASSVPFAAGAVEFTLAQVNYTGHVSNPTVSPYASVVFNYQNLPTANMRLGYQGSVAFVQTQQLTSVSVTSSSTTMRYYGLTYGTSASGSGAQQLQKVTECRDSSQTVCFPATVFTWSPATYSFATDTAQSGPNFSNLVSYKVGDVDGDGRQDIVWATNDGTCGSNSRINVSFLDRNTATGQMTLVTPTQSAFCAQRNLQNDDMSWGLIDYDGDGKADLIIAGAVGGNWSVFLSNGRPASGGAVFGSTDQLASLSPPIPVLSGPLTHPVMLQDVNGDGLLDIVYPVTPSASTGNASVLLRLLQRQSNGTLSFSAPYALDFQYSPGDVCGSVQCTSNFINGTGLFAQGADVNGDGKGDLMFFMDQPCGGACTGPTSAPATPSTSVQPLFDASLHPNAASPNITRFSNGWWYQFYADGTEPPAPGYTIPRFRFSEYWSALDYFSGGTFGGGSIVLQADVNGDGLTDLVYQDAQTPTTFWVMLNTGVVNQPNSIPVVNSYKLPISVTGIQNGTYLQVTDITGDGRADLVFPSAAGGTFSYVSLNPDGTFTSPQTVSGGGMTAGGTLSQWINLIGDFDGDGAPDFLRIQPASGSNLYTSRAASGVRYHPRDVITQFKNGFGATTTVTYQPLTNEGVYQRGGEAGYPAVQLDNYGWGSPVFDLIAPMYVVSQVSSSAPTQGAPNSVSTIYYRYAGGLLQAGGRGFLGFYETWTFDNNDLANVGNQYIVTVNSYAQNYPFIGMPLTTFKLAFTGALTRGNAQLDACAANPESGTYNCFAPAGTTPWPDLISNPATAGVTVGYGGSLPVCNGAGCMVPDQTKCTSSSTSILAPATLTSGNFTPPATAQPVYSYLYYASGVQADLSGSPGASGAAITAQTINYFCYDGSATTPSHGDLLYSRTITEDGSGNVVAQKLTSNTFADDTTNWFLGRLTNSTVTFVRPNTSNVVRTSDFTYDPSTGLLTSEEVERGQGANLDLLTVYTYTDASGYNFGNRTGAYQCSNGFTVSSCASTAGFTQQQSGTTVHRYAKTTFDSSGRYSTGSALPFYSVGGSGNLNEQTAISIGGRDEFGNATSTSSINGLTQTSEAGTLGRPYFSADNTGKASTTTFRFCGTGTNQVACSSDAMFKFRSQTVTAGAPSTWAYFDVLGRPVLTITQAFDGNQAGELFSATCGYYDAHNRPAYKSEPFFLNVAANADGSPALSGASPCASAGYATTNKFDVLGRVVLTTHPDGGTVSSSYVGLDTFVTNPRHYTFETDKNALGEVIETRDPDVPGDNSGLIVDTKYYADGNVQNVTRDALNNGNPSSTTKIVSQFFYDALGRKTSQTDPDSGSASFTYNAAGDVISQTDAKNQTVTQNFDALGRRWKRTTTTGADGNAITDTWTFDTAAHGFGLLASESRSSTSGATFSRTQSYDSYGRPYTRNTSIAGNAYAEVSAYDGYGRPMSQQDASGYTLITNYTTRGFLSDMTDSRVGTVYQVNTMTARGQVFTDTRGNTMALNSKAIYDPQTGRIQSICSGTNCGLQDLSYQFDLAGNLTQRERATRTAPTIEKFTNDALNRLKLAQLTEVQGVVQGSAITTASLVYDLLGNVCTKNGAAYTYAGYAGCANHGSSGSPQAVTQVGGTSYQYDFDGNQTTSNSGRTLVYNALNQLATASAGTSSTAFQYSPDGDHFLRTDVGSAVPPSDCPTDDTPNDRIFCNGFESGGSAGGTQTTYYVGNVEIIKNGSSTEIRRYLAGVAIDYVRSSGSNETRYLFADHLGSVDVVASSSGSLIEAMSFDVHGSRRDPYTWQGGAPVPVSTTHGYTGHEHVDAFEFIHMNGRIYDPAIGRMLQADPMTGPGNQSLNRYSYVINNPLALTDPSGYSWWSDVLRDVVSIVIVIEAPYLAPYLGGDMFAAYAVAGFAAGVVQTGTVQGGLYGAFSAELFFGIGQAFDSGGFANEWATDGVQSGEGTFGTSYNLAGFSAKVLAHGIAGGVMSSLEGDKFGNGFVSAGVAEAFSGAIDRLDPQNPIGQSVSAERVIAASLLGGTTSVIAGGKFGNGAITAAFGRAFNEESQKAPEASGSGSGASWGPNYLPNGPVTYPPSLYPDAVMNADADAAAMAALNPSVTPYTSAGEWDGSIVNGAGPGPLYPNETYASPAVLAPIVVTANALQTTFTLSPGAIAIYHTHIRTGNQRADQIEAPYGPLDPATLMRDNPLPNYWRSPFGVVGVLERYQGEMTVRYVGQEPRW